MKKIALILAIFLAVAPCGVQACPLCSEMVAAAGEEGFAEPDNFPKAVNQTIYLMLGIPYLSFFVVGFFVYRGMKKNQEYLDSQEGGSKPAQG